MGFAILDAIKNIMEGGQNVNRYLEEIDSILHGHPFEGFMTSVEEAIAEVVEITRRPEIRSGA